jgi:hypothetical protein
MEDVMKLGGLLLALAVAALPVTARARSQDAQQGWRQYQVPETGARVDIPTAIFSQDAGTAETGLGRRFLTSDGRANLTVQSIRNQPGDTPAAFLRRMNPPQGIVYKRVAPNFFVVSSFRNQNIWYNRCNFSGGFAHCVLINYPAAEKRQWDGIVTRISNTLASR